MTTFELIVDFLRQKRIAMVGVSRNPHDFSRCLFRELRDRGYDVVPVNPKTRVLEDVRCYARVQQIKPLVDGVLVMTAPALTSWVVRDCARAGITRVWLHRGRGKGAIHREAIAFCREHGIRVIPGFCPYMFLANAGLRHEAHAMAMKLEGCYPTPYSSSASSHAIASSSTSPGKNRTFSR